MIDKSVNEPMVEEKRRIPFKQFIYIGDSSTDIPCMRMIMKLNGYAIGVYDADNAKNKKTYLEKLISLNKINFMAKADYSKNSELETIMFKLIEKYDLEINY